MMPSGPHVYNYIHTHTLIYIEGANEFETWKDINHRKTDDKQKRKFQY